MGAPEISVQPEQVFAELLEVITHLNNVPKPGEFVTTGPTASESPAARATSGTASMIDRIGKPS